MRRLLKVLILSILTVVLVSCGSSKEKIIHVLWFDDSNESEVFMLVMQDYLQSNENIVFDIETVDFNRYDEVIQNKIEENDLPDIARVTGTHIANYGDELLVLDDRIDDLSVIKKQFFEGSMAFALNDNGEALALPTEATANGMIANIDALENAGIDIDSLSRNWKWEDWKSVMEKTVASNSGVDYGLVFDFSPHRFATLVYQAGGRFVSKDGMSMAFNSPESVYTLNFFKELHDEGLVPRTIWIDQSEKPEDLFRNGKAVFHIGGSWWINKYENEITGFRWKAVQMPSGKIRSSVTGGKYIAGFKSSPHKKIVAEIISVFSDQKHNAEYCLETYNLSARKDNISIRFPSRQKDFLIMAHELSITPAFTSMDWKNQSFVKIYSDIREQIVRGLTNEITMQEAAENIDHLGNQHF